MGNDCEDCGAQIPYGENQCEACEMGITEFYREWNQKRWDIYEMLDNLDKNLSNKSLKESKRYLRKLTLDVIRDVKHLIKGGTN